MKGAFTLIESKRDSDITFRGSVWKFNVLFALDGGKDQKKFSILRSISVIINTPSEIKINFAFAFDFDFTACEHTFKSVQSRVFGFG